jgi:ribonuclease HI
MNSHDQTLAKDPRERPFIFYTDRSGIEGKVGAAAIVSLEDQYGHSQMGDDDTSIVYAAELRAIDTGLTFISERTEPWAAQAENGACHLCRKPSGIEGSPPRMASEQVYLTRYLDLIRQLGAKGIQAELRWIPSHQGIIGNEVVDQHAKEAAQELEGPQSAHNRYIRLAAATNNEFAARRGSSGRGRGQRRAPADQ